jgi:hypothetical protein
VPPHKANLQAIQSAIFWVTVGVTIYYILTHPKCRTHCSIWFMGLSLIFDK